MKKNHIFQLLLTYSLVTASFVHASNLPLKRYRLEISGAPSKAVEKHLRESSKVASGKDKLSHTLLNNLVKDEKERWIEVLKAYGYFDGAVFTRVRETPNNWVVSLHVVPNKQYEITEVNFKVDEKLETPSNYHPFSLPIAAKNETILNLEHHLLYFFQTHGYAEAKFKKKSLYINENNKSVQISYELEKGPYFFFGESLISGLKKVEPRFIRYKTQYNAGEPYNLALIRETESELDGSGLFSTVSVSPKYLDSKSGELPIQFELDEAARRSIAVGANIATDAGAGGRFEWENRNYSGIGDLLAFRALHSKRQKRGYFLYTRPDFLRANTSLRWSLELNNETIRSYQEKNWEVNFSLERKLSKKLFFSYGVSTQYLKTTQTEDNSSKGLLSLPLVLNWNNSEKPLNPKNGRSHSIHLTPFLPIENSSPFIHLQLKNAIYLPLTRSLTLAFSGQVASLMGSSKHDIPPPLRIYEGSSHTLRGYSYKTVSPLNDELNPDGGRSMVSFAFEPRYQISEAFELVPFYEIGQVYSRPTPQPSERYFRSIGLGIYINTLIGPIRLDLAIPMDRRSELDKGLQVYLSIGTAF